MNVLFDGFYSVCPRLFPLVADDNEGSPLLISGDLS